MYPPSLHGQTISPSIGSASPVKISEPTALNPFLQASSTTAISSPLVVPTKLGEHVPFNPFLQQPYTSIATGGYSPVQVPNQVGVNPFHSQTTTSTHPHGSGPSVPSIPKFQPFDLERKWTDDITPTGSVGQSFVGSVTKPGGGSGQGYKMI
jgi:hypothetical protein